MNKALVTENDTSKDIIKKRENLQKLKGEISNKIDVLNYEKNAAHED